LMSGINNDIRNDGILNDQNLLLKMFNASIYIDTNYIKSKLYEKYAAIGSPFILPDFVKYLNQFVTHNAAGATNWGMTFPDDNFNLLIPNKTVFTFIATPNVDNYYSLKANIPTGKSLTVKLYELNTNPLTESPHFGYYVNVDGPPFGFIQPVVLDGKYCAIINPELVPSIPQLFPYHRSDIKVTQPGQYLIEYYVDGSLTPVFTKNIEFQ
jgi:hypothetical protein